MSAEEINTSFTGEETHSTDGIKADDANSAATGLSALITSKEVVRQIRAATDTLKKPLEMLCNLMRQLRWDRVRPDEGTSAPAQGPSGPRGSRYNNSSVPKTKRRWKFGGIFSEISTKLQV